MNGGPLEIVHCALEPPAGEPLAETSASDRRKMAVLLQGAGALCLVSEAGWRLCDPWSGARVDGEGLLRGLAAEPGQDEELAQVRLRALALELFGGESGVCGRGAARRSVRLLLDRWRQEVAPLAPARAVAQVFEAAPFLWQQPFGQARAAALLGARVYDRWKVPWAAGSEAFRSRLTARCADRRAMERALASAQARDLWEPETARREPLELAAAGRWAAAVRAWERRGPATGGERQAFAEALHAVGRWQDALGVLRGLRGPEARVLRLDCLLRLGRLGGARRALGGLGRTRLPAPLLVETAELAVRVLSNLGDADEARRWVDEALRRATAETATRAQLVAAGSAWDRRDPEAMAHHLREAGTRPADPPTRWRWHYARALAAELAEDGAAMVAELGAALSHRRSLRRFEAAGLWNELGIGRALCGDLAGAERAFLHALRLQEEVQGPRRTTLALCNLAEIRLRRGRLRGVREILDRSRAENREAGNRRGLLQDGELEVRYELVTGRPREALERCRSLLASLEAEGPDWRRAELAALAARALGWLGEPAEALRMLEDGGANGLSALEAEERPAVWALAGDRERALAAVSGPARALWNAVLTGASVTEEWEALDSLEPYRAARLVYDLQHAAPGQAPAARLRAAAGELRRVGALRFAEELEALDAGPWRTLEAYLAGEPGSPARRGELLHALVPGARLALVRDGVEEILVDGPGGPARLDVAVPGGRLELHCAGPGDPPTRALLRLIARDVPPPSAGSASTSPPGVAPGIVGCHPELLRALDRIEKLASAPLPLLVVGETGTGKELFARRAHEVGPRAAGPFVPVNCAELSESLLLSELFGHVRGAFTGADRDRAGIFETARDGTVFLDEIGDLPLTAQSKLLRVLQEGEVRRVGESLPRHVDVGVVAATHRDLAAMVAEGCFREDLFFRLQTATIELPPLRRRGDDLRLLTDHFLRRLAPGREVRLTAAAWRRLAAHPWPGNVRELRSTLAVAVALAGGDEIDEPHLELPTGEVREPAGSYHEQVEALRRRLVREALEAAGGNRAEAARRLGLSRQALSYLVRELGLYRP